tara:strand:- start:186 stop:743 length:558 start_codon:yes stop_codon:yes gene_type:complete
MARGWSSDNQTAIAASLVRPVNLVKLEFVSGTIYYTDADRDLVFDGNTYLGTGVLAGFSSVEEGVELQTYSLTLSLSGIPSSVISLALSENFQNRLATLYTGFLNDSYALIADPIEMFKGRINQMNIESGDTSTVSLSIESRLVDWERPRIRRYNNADQQVEYSGDLGFEFVPQMVEKELVWGRS